MERNRGIERKKNKINKDKVVFFVLLVLILAWVVFVFAYDYSREKARAEVLPCPLTLEAMQQPIQMRSKGTNLLVKKERLVLIHRVVKGETLFRIAKFYGIGVNEILKANPIIDAKAKEIRVGQKLKIPTRAYLGKPFYYTVKKGDTIAGIAEKFGTFGDIIAKDNSVEKFIFPGQKLKVRRVIVPATEVVASWYGRSFHGKEAANGKPFDMHKFTAAHRWLPLGIRLRVRCNREEITVTITDRGPYYLDREIDLSYAAAKKLKTVFAKGVSRVVISGC